jgi:xylan 1,4-beta-xylosidase
MPGDLARNAGETVFHYRGIISPPHDWDRWVDLVTALARHLVDRYGLDEVRRWAFEIWNEPNLDVFWSGTVDEYFHLYDVSAAAVKSVDDRLAVGGPATAAVGWIDDFLDHTNRSGAAVDFLSTHAYGNAPLDLRPATDRFGRPGLPVWWTEWGAHATHFNSVHDSVWSAAYLARGMASAIGRVDAVAYWTVSDHFEELGRPETLFHGGFGLLGLGNLRKPRWWALWMLEQLRPQRVDVSVEGDGAGDMVNAVGSCDDDGSLAIVIWNGTVDVSKAAGDPVLDRHVELAIRGLQADSYEVRHRRIDEIHSNVTARWARLGEGRAWPDDEEWAKLHAADDLADLTPPTSMSTTHGSLGLSFDLPMPAVSLIELRPYDAALIRPDH